MMLPFMAMAGGSDGVGPSLPFGATTHRVPVQWSSPVFVSVDGFDDGHRACPVPLTTAFFPDNNPATCARKRKAPVCDSLGMHGGRRQRRRKTESQLVNNCSICLTFLRPCTRVCVAAKKLDPVGHSPTPVTFPCGHAFHRGCVHQLLTAPTIGPSAMMRCPMCRAPLDRYDLHNMGYVVSPRTLAVIVRRCDALSVLGKTAGVARIAHRTSQPVSRVLAGIIRQCAGTTASDGFVYNTAVLALDRAMFHRRDLVESLKQQLRDQQNTRFDAVAFIQTAVDCHIEVLIRTGVPDDEAAMLFAPL